MQDQSDEDEDEDVQLLDIFQGIQTNTAATSNAEIRHTAQKVYQKNSKLTNQVANSKLTNQVAKLQLSDLRHKDASAKIGVEECDNKQFDSILRDNNNLFIYDDSVRSFNL